ncbi:MAG: 50S ribosomal protein L6 [Eubacteriales bacterium]|nr:50S ribosomal protein L6 [Eubacteriales bacterium]
MSRIGKKPVPIPDGVEVKYQNHIVTVSKGNNQLVQKIDPSINVEVQDGVVQVSRSSDTKEVRALHGLYRSLIHNMVVGVDEGYEKKLRIEGVGYKAEKQGNKLVLSVGLSHQVFMEEPAGITYEVPGPNQIVVKGIDKQLVGEMTAKIRAVRPPEPYKGKGIRYDGEVVRLKEGKTGA